jgi:hypothetical protein
MEKSMDDYLNLEKTLIIAKKILAKLEFKKAGYTFLSIPPELEIELEEKQKEVIDLEDRLAKAIGAGRSVKVSQPSYDPQQITLQRSLLLIFHR